jgi:uncharacterized membrane protein
MFNLSILGGIMEVTEYTGSTRWHDLVVNKITISEPLTWLKKGWEDFSKARSYSLRYAAFFVVISSLITYFTIATDNHFLLIFLFSGFFIVAPSVGIGLYQMSSFMERGEPLKSCNAWEAFKQNQGQISMVTGGFLIILQLWVSMNFVLFALLYMGISPPLDNFFSSLYFSEEGRFFALASVTLGFLFALWAFSISVVTVPMLIDRKVDGFTAIRFSVKSVLNNFWPMMLWALLIVTIVGIGMLTFYIGLLIALPLIGHASWHAYKALVPVSENEQKKF